MGLALAERSETGFEQQLRLNPCDENEKDRLLPCDVLPAPVLPTKVPRVDANDCDPRTLALDEKLKVRPLVRFSTMQPPVRKFEVLQQFEGIVTGIEKDTVWADLHDLTDPANPIEVVEIPLREFSQADALLLRPGSAFYWIMGYDTSPGGTITRASEIRVRRTAQWSRRSISEIKAKAHEMYLRMTDGHKE
jgi:hypothetical protein